MDCPLIALVESSVPKSITVCRFHAGTPTASSSSLLTMVVLKLLFIEFKISFYSARIIEK